MGYGTRPHDWKSHELEYSTWPNPSSPISMCQAGVPHQAYLTPRPTTARLGIPLGALKKVSIGRPVDERTVLGGWVATVIYISAFVS
jgi:hypothetical protein